MAKKRRSTKRKSHALVDRLPLPTLIKNKLKKYVIVINLVLVLVFGGWYVIQPAPRRTEINTLVMNYFDRNKEIEISELILDIWSYYYSKQFIDSNYQEAADSILYAGTPKVVNASYTIKPLANKGYISGYADSLRNPLWVAYRLYDLEKFPQAPERPDSFQTDKRSRVEVRTQDYSGSGYDRGHMAPNYAMAVSYGKQAQLESFLMTNIIPQTHALNAGPWKELEQRAIKNYTGRFHEIWVVTGPIFSKKPKKMKSGVPIPEGSYKIFVDENEGRLRIQAFIMPQKINRSTDLSAYLVSVDEIEQRTGLDFFHLLDDAIESQLEAKKLQSVW